MQRKSVKRVWLGVLSAAMFYPEIAVVVMGQALKAQGEHRRTVVIAVHTMITNFPMLIEDPMAFYKNRPPKESLDMPISCPISPDLWPLIGQPVWTNELLSFTLIPPPPPPPWNQRPAPMLDTNLLEVSFVLPKQEYIVGELVKCECLMKNTSGKERYYLTDCLQDNIVVEVLTAPRSTRHRRSETAMRGALMAKSYLLLKWKVGEVCREPLLLNPLVDLTEPGTYKLRLKLLVEHADDIVERNDWSSGYAFQTLSFQIRTKDR